MNAELRHAFINLALKHQRAGTGSELSFLIKRTAQMQWTDLTTFLAPLRFAVVGAVAARLYMPERMTKDIVFVIMASDAKEARQRLRDAGFVYLSELSIKGSSWTSPDGAPIDVLEGTDIWLPQAISEAQSNRDADGLPILPLPYLVLMKFTAGRVQDLADVSRMLGQANDTALAEVRTLFARYLPADRDDIESLISLGKLELS